MSNHYLVVLHVDSNACKKADAKDIDQKWHQFFKGKDAFYNDYPYEFCNAIQRVIYA